MILETERLTLELLDESYLPQLAELLANPIVHRYFPKVLNREETEAFLAKVKNRQKKDGYSFWAAVRKNDRQFLGICGLLKQIIDGKDEVEVGYRIDNVFWGKGYGTEAAAGCMHYARDVVKAESVISLILPVNAQSIRVAEKNGLRFEKETLFHGMTHRVYRMLFKAAEQ